MTVTNVKSQIRRGPSSTMPRLAPGELGLATNQNRVFVGTDPVLGTFDAAECTLDYAFVQFFEELDAVSFPVDLDTVHTDFWRVEVNGVELGANLVVAMDEKVQVTHQLSLSAAQTATYVLRRNKELNSYNADRPSETVRKTAFTKVDPAGVTEQTGISFAGDFKDTIKLNYVLWQTSGQRQGALDITVGNSTSITDNYTTAEFNDDLVFTIEVDANGRFQLMYDSSSTERYQLNYTEVGYLRSDAV